MFDNLSNIQGTLGRSWSRSGREHLAQVFAVQVRWGTLAMAGNTGMVVAEVR